MPEITTNDLIFLIVMCIVWFAGTVAVLYLGQHLTHWQRH